MNSYGNILEDLSIISSSKKYRNLAGFLVKSLNDKSTPNGDVAKFLIRFKDIVLPNNTLFKGVQQDFYSVVDFRDIRYVEDSGIIYIGADLSRQIGIRIDPYDRIKDDIYGRIQNPDTFASLNDNGLSGINYISVVRDKDLIKKSDLYKNYRTIADSLVTGSVSFSLREGEFPKLRDRNLLPCMWIDPKKGKIFGFKFNNESSYTSNNTRIDISDNLGYIKKCAFNAKFSSNLLDIYIKVPVKQVIAGVSSNWSGCRIYII